MIGHAETVHNVLNELDGLGCIVFDEWFVLYPFGERVDGDEDVLESSFGFLELSDLI